MAIRLIGIDLDGTLLNSRGHVSEDNQHALRYAIEKGATPVICSGRMYSTAIMYVHPLGLHTPAVVCNGAEVRDEQLIYHRSVLDDSVVNEVLECSARFGVYPVVCDGNSMFIEKKHEAGIGEVFGTSYDEKDFYTLQEDMRALMRTARSEGVVKVVIVSADEEALANTRSQLEQNAQGRYEVTCSWSSSMDVISAGSSKGAGLLLLAQRLGIAPDEIMAIGDQENDLPMFEVAGVSVAMGNATAEAKARAKYTTLTNDQSGVAAAIRRFV